MTIAKHPHDLFDERFEISPETGCWLWTGAMFEHGYGHFSSRYSGKKWIDCAHRVSWVLYRGEIPKGLFVCHRCDTPRCVNPNHLFLGTSRENTHDAVSKGRMNKPSGEKNIKAKLKANDVRRIRELHTGGVSVAKIAEQFPVNDQSIRNIIHGLNWAHVT